MISLISLIDQIALGLYFLIAAAILFALRRYLIHCQEYRSTYFELERDLSRYRRANVVTAIIFLLELALIIIGIQRVVLPELRRDGAIAALVAERQQGDGVFVTPVPAPPAANLGIEPVEMPRSADFVNQVQATPVPTATLVGTIIPLDAAQGCDSPQAQLHIPANGMRVFQPIPVAGTAFTEQFGHATIEISGPETFDAFILLRGQIPETRQTQEIAQFAPAGYATGEYEFRLMVYDIRNALKAFCLVHIYISEPIPSPTPLQ